MGFLPLTHILYQLMRGMRIIKSESRLSNEAHIFRTFMQSESLIAVPSASSYCQIRCQRKNAEKYIYEDFIWYEAWTRLLNLKYIKAFLN